jgi:hypothetical protein
MKYFFTLLILSVTLFGCTNKDQQASKLDKKGYKEKKESLLDNEKSAPKEFLSITGTDKRNFWGQTVYRGVIHNTAKVCSYKDIRVKLLYYKTDGTLVTNHEEQFDETVKPGNEIEFKAKYKTPRGTDSVAASIMSAVAVGEN